MFPQETDLWKHYNSFSNSRKTCEKKVSCAHCGMKVKFSPESMKAHLITCQSYQKFATSQITNHNSKRKLLPIPIVEDKSSTILNMGVIGDGTNTDFLNLHIGSAESFGKIQMVSGCFTFVNSQRSHFASLYSIPYSRCYSSFSEFCLKESTKNVQVLFLSSTLNSHFTMAIEAMERGFHIMCESPLCMTENEAITLYKASQVQGCVFHIINPYCFYPMIHTIQQLIENHFLGEIKHIYIEHYQNHRLNDSESNDPMEMGVSDCTARLGIPAYEIMRFIYKKPVYRLMACLSSATSDDLFDDNGYISLELEGGVNVTMVLSKMALLHENEMRIQIEGTKASIEWNNLDYNQLKICFVDGRKWLVDSSIQQLYEIPIQPCKTIHQIYSEMYKDFYEHICSVLKGQVYCPLGITVREAMESIYFLSMCVTSNLHGNSWVELRIPDIIEEDS